MLFGASSLIIFFENMTGRMAGFIREDIDETIKGIANVGRNAMHQTDVAILDIM